MTFNSPFNQPLDEKLPSATELFESLDAENKDMFIDELRTQPEAIADSVEVKISY